MWKSVEFRCVNGSFQKKRTEDYLAGAGLVLMAMLVLRVRAFRQR